MSDDSKTAFFQSWLRDHHITEVECIIADINGIARGKILPAEKFIRSLDDDSLRLPESIFIQTVTGEYPEEDVIDPVDRDIRLWPDPNSIRLVPWYPEPTAQVLADIKLPVRCPTMPAFGGTDLRTLYVTTASLGRPADELAAQPLAGCVLQMRVEVPGLPVPAVDL